MKRMMLLLILTGCTGVHELASTPPSSRTVGTIHIDPSKGELMTVRDRMIYQWTNRLVDHPPDSIVIYRSRARSGADWRVTWCFTEGRMVPDSGYGAQRIDDGRWVRFRTGVDEEGNFWSEAIDTVTSAQPPPIE